MAQPRSRKRSRTTKRSRPKSGRTTRARRAPRRRRARSLESQTRRALETLEGVRRAPLEPELPIDPNAPAEAVDGDALEVLNETQRLVEDDPDAGMVGEPAIDRRRGAVLTGGDVDAAVDEVDVGEETVGGSTPTPDQDVVDDLGRAAGVTYADGEPLRPEEKIVERDEHRWEIDPASAEDYRERIRELKRRRSPGAPVNEAKSPGAPPAPRAPRRRPRP
jgi:hypothetical protein